MRTRKIASLALAFILLILPVNGTVFADTASQNSSKRYIVKFKTSSVDKSKVVTKYSGKLKHQFNHLNAASVEMTAAQLQNLKNDSNIEYVEEDYIVKAAATYTNWGVSDISAPSAWSSGYTGTGVKIAVIDTGAGPHSDLSIAGGTNVINGSGTSSYNDDNGHGTHVAGIIAGQGVNGGVKGVAPGAMVYAVKALDSTGSGYTSDIIFGIEWAIDNKMDIISMSLGTSQSDLSLKNAVDTAYSKGILVVAAAGNDGNTYGTGTNIEYPANYDSVIAVGAVDFSNTRAYFSSTGSKLEVSAPGVSITSTWLNGGYASMSGTSMATPFAAGDLALLKQKYPTYSNVQLRQLLDSGVTDLGTSGRDTLYGYGLIKAPAGTQSITISAPTASLAAGTYSSSQTVVLSDSTPGASIYYTLDGTTPSKSSKLYSSPISISSTTTLKAVAIDITGNTSPVLSVTYIMSSPVIPSPIISVPSGSYKGPITIKLYTSYNKPLIAYYTLDGSTPTTKSSKYTGSIIIRSSCTLKVIAADYYGNTSGASSSTYAIAPVSSRKTGRYTGIYKTYYFRR